MSCCCNSLFVSLTAEYGTYAQEDTSTPSDVPEPADLPSTRQPDDTSGGNSSSVKCPPGWIFDPSAPPTSKLDGNDTWTGARCYSLRYEAVTAFDIEFFCREASLAGYAQEQPGLKRDVPHSLSIHSQRENDFVAQYVAVGVLSQPTNTGVALGGAVGYSQAAWFDGTPWNSAVGDALLLNNASTSGCIVLRDGAVWWVAECSDTRPFVCAVDVWSAPLTTPPPTTTQAPAPQTTAPATDTPQPDTYIAPRPWLANASSICPDGWTFWDGSGKCYKAFFVPSTAFAAEESCFALDPRAHLTSILDQAENVWVRDYFVSQSGNAGQKFIIGGLFDTLNQGVWTDHSANWSAWPPPWAPNEPAEPFGCVAVSTTPRPVWMWQDCRSEVPYVCSYANTPSQATWRPTAPPPVITVTPTIVPVRCVAGWTLHGGNRPMLHVRAKVCCRLRC